MPDHCIPFRETGYFSPLICDYLDELPSVKPLYDKFPTVDNFKTQISEKGKSFPKATRKTLVSVLKRQYQGVELSNETASHIGLLEQDNTFTVTTGHQLNLFTGPLYFLYKIVSTINLCNELSENYPDSNFVPIYWMATEDHDFEEINHFNFKRRKIQWNQTSGGAVGALTTDGINAVYEEFSQLLGDSKNAKSLKALFSQAYLNHDNLTDATRYLANALFGSYGLVILDGHDKELKSLFVTYMKEELLHNTSSSYVEETNKNINSIPDKKYRLQVNPREINLFYLKDNLRERIISRDGSFYVNNTALVFSEEELIEELHNNPQHFSPNVILRPLYQEVVLPNLCYIGGGGELAYWLQLKSFFKSQQMLFPILLLRNSALLISQKQFDKIEKLDLALKEMFLPKHELEAVITKRVSEIDIDFSAQKEHLKDQFKQLYDLAKKTDKSFVGAVAAQEQKQLKGIAHLEKRLLKAQKRKLSDFVGRATALQEELFPNGGLQERTHNFSEWYLAYGERLLPMLFKELQPLNGGFLVIVL